jgi:Zn ribbon nucleic-acid-binding protein
MSEPWGTVDGACPKCLSTDIAPEDEGSWPECMECGFIFYSQESLALQAEVRAEFEEAKRQCWPDPVPDYRTWKQMRGARHD